jgi:uncharacterized protein (DUF433 family)
LTLWYTYDLKGLIVAESQRNLSLYGGKDPRHMPIYTVDDAARILWLAPSTLKSWTMGQQWTDPYGKERQFIPLIIPPNSDDQLLSFTNLIEAHVLRAIRRVHKIKMRAVRDAMTAIRQEFESMHPLAEVDLFTEGKSIIVQYGGYVNMSSGKQSEMENVIAIYLKRIDREENKLARFFPFFNEPRIQGPGIEEQPKFVSVDPFVSFGRPVVSGTNIRTEAIADRFFAGDSVDDLCDDFKLDRTTIEAAVRYERPRPIVDAEA